ncbi:MAG: hypothetical protein ABSG59_10120 [Verrucomicrobiota bacterium]|jgi:hypothetical protein
MPKETATAPAAPELAAENAVLKARLAELEAAKKQNDADEEAIAAKMARGLRREQAIAVIQRQREYDARTASNRKQAK